MRYMLLIYTREDGAALASQEERTQIINGHRAVMDETRGKGILQGAEPLAPAATATTVRQQNGNTLVTDGPFAETKEQLAGYYILDCKDVDEAIAWAAKIPTACGGVQGCVEVRALRALPARDEVAAAEPQYAS
ncbi:MAG TPA: YciI family protein [Candidatus Angelobacter sp.]